MRDDLAEPLGLQGGTRLAAQEDSLPVTVVGRGIMIAGTGVAVFLAQLISIQLWIPPTGLSTIWLHGGLLLAVVILAQPRQWPGILAAGGAGVAGALWLFGSVSPLSAGFLGAVTAGTTFVTGWMLRRVLGRSLTLSGLREFLVYLGVAVVGGAVVASSLFVASAWGFGFRPATFQLWRTFGLSAVLGYLTVTPTVLLLVRQADGVRHATWLRRIEAGVLVVLLVVVSGIVFYETTNRQLVWPAFAVTFPPLMIWAALRFYSLGASGALLLVTLVSTLSTGRGLGPFVANSAEANTLSLQLFILGTGLPLLALAIVLEEQRRTMATLVTTQQRLQALNRDLIAAREDEATRIARELHDDVGQRLALVSIGLSRLRRAATSGTPSPLEEVVRLQEQTGTVAGSLRELSRQLHPAALEHAGLAIALEMQCEEVRQVTGLRIQVIRKGVLPGLPSDVALCLYRVAQEAITNAVRHSGARSIDVAVWQEDSQVLLSVRDDGRGFRPDDRHGRGLGLHSLTERVRLHGGRLTIDSAPGRGTQVRAAIPAGTAGA